MKNLHAQRPLSREFRRNKSSLLKNVNRAFYCHLKMPFRRQDTKPEQDKTGGGTISILPLYVDFFNGDGINGHNEMISVPPF